MKRYDMFFGTLQFYDTICQFVFEDYKLHIDVSNTDLVKSLFSQEHPDLATNCLFGKIATETETVFFSFKKNAYDSTINIGHLVASRITIYVDYYLVLKKPLPLSNLFIQFHNDSFQKWLGLYPKFIFEMGSLEKTNIVLENSTLECKSNFAFGGKRYVAYPSYKINNSIVEYKFSSYLEIECCDNMTYDSLFELSNLVLKIIRFSFYRYYVDLGEVIITQKITVEGGTYRQEVGKLFFRYDKKPIEPIRMTHLYDYGFFKWIDLYKYLNCLVAFIETNSIYLFNLPEKRLDRFRTDIASVSTISAAFECEFSYFFPKYVSTKINDKEYIDLKNKLMAMEKSKKQTTLVNNMIKYYFSQPTLAEKAKYALEQFGDVIKVFKLDKELNLKQISKCFKMVRNKIDHGDLTIIIDSETANTFYYFRILILCMQLSRMGVDKDKLSEMIKPVLSLDYNR